MNRNNLDLSLSLIAETLPPEYHGLLPELTKEERASFVQNVKPECMSRIETWIGTREQIERILFWDRGGKYDAPEWRELEPYDKKSRLLFQKASERFHLWKEQAVEIQLRSDLTLYSQFNDALLFTGLSGAVRCDKNGREDELRGRYFHGIEFRCIGSVENEINFVRIDPLEGEIFEVSFGSSPGSDKSPMRVYSGDSYTLLQLEKLISRDFPKTDWHAELLDGSGKPVTLNPKVIRQAARRGDPLPYGNELVLKATLRAKGMDAAIDKAAEGVRFFYERFGLETECYKIGKNYGNFHIVRDDNFDDFITGKRHSTHRGLVLFTATLACRRCRREIPSFLNLAGDFPDITFGLVNIASPQSKFYERVFGDMGGGDAKRFRNNPLGSTPFTIIYAPNADGRLEFKEYYGTEKAEAPPMAAEIQNMLRRHFRKEQY